MHFVCLPVASKRKDAGSTRLTTNLHLVLTTNIHFVLTTTLHIVCLLVARMEDSMEGTSSETVLGYLKKKSNSFRPRSRYRSRSRKRTE